MEELELSKLTTSVAWVKGIGELFKDEGLDVNALFSEAGLDVTVLDNPDGRYPTEKVSLLWELAVIHSGNQMIGIAKPRKAKPANFDVVGYAMMSCPNLLASLEKFGPDFEIEREQGEIQERDWDAL